MKNCLLHHVILNSYMVSEHIKLERGYSKNPSFLFFSFFFFRLLLFSMATSNSANSPSTNTSPSPSPTTIDVYHNNTPLSPSDDTLIIINIASQAPLKLTAQKYSFWHSQWFSHLYGCNLKGYVDGTRDCYTDRDTSNPSLTFEQSHTLRQVHLLHSTLMASFSPSIANFVCLHKILSFSLDQVSSNICQTF